MSKNKRQVVDQKDLIKLYRQALRDGVPLDKIEKKVEKLAHRVQLTESREVAEDKQRNEQLKQSRMPKAIRLGAAVVPLAFLGVGLFLVGSAVMPIVGYYVNTLPDIRANQLASPIPQEDILDVTPLIVAQASVGKGAEVADEDFGEKSGPVIIDIKLDYTNLSNWFNDEDLHDLTPVELPEELPQEYALEIPKLNISEANVQVGGTDLNKSLIQYPGTAMPGKAGSPVVFGHSVLRQFYNPKETNPRRYNSIFSTIMTLEKGDKIYLKHGNVKYTYMVQEKSEVKPTDTYILSQRYDVRQLKLVTCVPEGTYLRRGVVTAQLVKE